MSDDASDRAVPPPGVVAHVALGGVELVLGDPGGTEIVALGVPAQPPRELIAAIVPRSQRDDAPGAGVKPLEDALADASSVTGKIERALSLFTDVAQGRLEPAALAEEIDALLGLLGRLDREKRLREALRLARALAMLLALLQRWVELVDSLKTALHAARELVDESGQAWVLHELGTLHLAADDLPGADSMLTEAREMRERIGERRAMALTERNLRALCQTLRRGLHEPGPRARTRPSRAVMLALAIVPLLIGGAAGAMVRGSGGSVRTAADITASSGSSTHIPATSSSSQARTGTGGGGGTSTGPSQATHTAVVEKTGEGAGTVQSGDGVIECGDDCSHSYADGKALTLSAEAADGSKFLGWGGACTGEGPCQLTMSADRNVTASFAPRGVTLTISMIGEGAGAVRSSDGQVDCEETCSVDYAGGAQVTLTATDSDNFVFAGWGGACSGVGSCTPTLDGNVSVTARYERRESTSPAP